MALQDVVVALTGTYEWVMLSVLFVSAMIEYVIPPFPGDTVTLAGALLITAYDYSFLPVFLAVLAGGLAGAAIDFYFGVWLSQSGRIATSRWQAIRTTMNGMDKVAKAFARHGEAYIVINRFLPGVRAFLFLFAGMVGMRFGRVMFFALISGIAWNLLVVGAGMMLGANIDLLEKVFRHYTMAVWIILAVVALLALWRWRRSRLK